MNMPRLFYLVLALMLMPLSAALAQQRMRQSVAVVPAAAQELAGKTFSGPINLGVGSGTQTVSFRRGNLLGPGYCGVLSFLSDTNYFAAGNLTCSLNQDGRTIDAQSGSGNQLVQLKLVGDRLVGVYISTTYGAHSIDYPQK